MLIWPIWLKGVEFILPKRLSSPKIVYTLCFFNEGNFSIPHTMMFVILKVSVKWRLFDGIPFNEIPMGGLIIVKSRSKTFRTTFVLFRTCFAWKKIHNIVGTTVQSGLIQYSLWVLKDLNVSVVTTCLHISHLVPPHDLQEPFFFSRGATFALTRISFKHLALLNWTTGILSKTLPLFSVRC